MTEKVLRQVLRQEMPEYLRGKFAVLAKARTRNGGRR